jgi:hypothetical protein
MTLQATTFADDGAPETGSAPTAATLTVLPARRPDAPEPATTAVESLDAADPSASRDSALREVAIEDLLRLLDASRRLQVTLAANEKMCEASVRKMMDGTAPADVLVDINVAGARLDLAGTLEAFERARHRSRSTFIAAQFESGMNMKEIARNWAISRQLAHRFFTEARRND